MKCHYLVVGIDDDSVAELVVVTNRSDGPARGTTRSSIRSGRGTASSGRSVVALVDCTLGGILERTLHARVKSSQMHTRTSEIESNAYTHE